MICRFLDSNWTVRRRDEEPGYYQPAVAYVGAVPASIPGNVHLDLAAAGVIPDPFVGCFEGGLRWVDEEAWVYRCEFEWSPGEHSKQVLQFAGLDTICLIRLNGSELARHDNMFVPLEVDVSGRLADGRNLLEVEFESAVLVGQERRRSYLEQEGMPFNQGWFDERAFVRKAQYMSGWDWGPRFVSCGIWRPVRLLEFTNRIVRASVLQERLEDSSFRVWVEAEVDGDSQPKASLRSPDGEEGGEGKLEFLIREPQLWWPNGEGEQPLYDLCIWVEGHEIRKRIGLRTIKLVREPDEIGTSFEFEVNERRIWARGANWIPNDSFLGRESGIKKQIETCRQLNMNMLRVWGGGVYESEEFYDACDELGILVWQDFPFACSYYPDDCPAQVAVQAEAEANILRLRDRTSLALWCGNNENLAMYEGGWGGKENLPPRYYGSRLYDEVLPAAVRKLDPSRDYIPTSPLLPSDESNSDAHYWDVWHGRGDWKHYADSKTRFSSEFGFASSCGLATWSSVLHPGQDHPRSREVRWHDKTTKPVEVFEGMVLQHYPQWETLEEWVYYSQLNQRDALRFGIEHYRRSSFCRGSLIWQFNDCWPVQSWAVQDHARELKPAGFELARLYAPAMLSVVVGESVVELWGVNDGAAPYDGHVVLDFIDTVSGLRVRGHEFESRLAPGQREVVGRAELPGLDRRQAVIRASWAGVPDSETWRLLCEPKDMRLGTPRLSYTQEGDRLTVAVEGFAYDLTVWGDGLLVSGLPGLCARSVANGILEYRFSGDIASLKARSMAGPHPLA